jgi:undecaprenyl-diphosphatase
MIEFLNSIDTELFIALNPLHNRWFDSFMMLTTGRFVWVPMYCALLYAMMRKFGAWTAIKFAIGIAITIAITDQLCATLIRPEVARLRPANLDNPLSALVHIVDNYRGGRHGFPSCHGANSFGLATVIALLFTQRRIGIFIFTWALIVCYTRIYLGVHYPGDILVGAVIGISIASVTFLITRRLCFGKQPIIPCFNRHIQLWYYPGTDPKKIHPEDFVVGVGVITFITIALVSTVATH